MMGRKTKVALTVGAAGVAAWAASKVVVKPKPRPSKEALAYKDPVVLCTCANMSSVPDYTMAAFSKAAEIGVHGFAVDIRLTKDEEIVIFRDETVEQTTDFSGKVSEYTCQELKQADAGYMFADETGQYIYRNTGQSIVTLRELIEEFPQLLIAVNLKDSPDTYEGSLMPSKLWRLIEETGAEDRIIVMSVYDEQTDRFNLYAQQKVATGAGNDEVKKAYAAYSSKLGHLYNPRADVFNISEKMGVFPLNSEGFITFLSKLNVAVFYQDAVNSSAIEKLLKSGAKGILTNEPEIALNIIQKHTTY